VRLDKMGFNPLITVHDSIVSEVRKEDGEDLCREQIRVMEEAARDLYGDRIPFIAEGGIGARWGEIS